MATPAPPRVALMSIRPRWARAILDGRKTVEFRKRPLADDVTHVVIYSTVPDKAVIGYFSIDGQDTRTPDALWDEYHDAGEISQRDFFAYYAGRQRGTGIRVGRVHRLKRALGLQSDLGIARAPQSFQYLGDDAFYQVVLASRMLFDLDRMQLELPVGAVPSGVRE